MNEENILRKNRLYLRKFYIELVLGNLDGLIYAPYGLLRKSRVRSSRLMTFSQSHWST